MTAALILVAVLLVIGVLCRARIRLFRLLYIPASVIAGLVGLALAQSMRWLDPPDLEWQPLVAELGSWPGWLIAVVFAALLLEKQAAPWRSSLGRVSRQVVMVWIIVLGQTAIGLLMTWWLIQPFYDVPNSFGMLIETGFAGGHGTAAAMGVVLAHPLVDLPSGLALGTLMATAGLIYGVVSGIVWINIGVRAGWIARSATADAATQVSDGTGKPIGYEVIDRNLVDSLLLQMVWLALAFGIGMALQSGVRSLGQWMDPPRVEQPSAEAASTGSAASVEVATSEGAEAELRKRLTPSEILGSFPLFIYTLVGGWIVRRALTIAGIAHWIDGASIQRLSAVAMDVLVVAAIASLNLRAVVELIVPFTILLAAGCVWTGVCLLWISPRVLPRAYWFPLGLINYGMSTGTTATGFVLLRIVDPEVRSGAAEDYALAAPFSAPFIGGGMITIALPLWVLERVPIAASSLVLTAIVAILIIGAMRVRPE